MEIEEIKKLVQYYLQELENLEKTKRRIYSYLLHFSKKYKIDIAVP